MSKFSKGQRFPCVTLSLIHSSVKSKVLWNKTNSEQRPAPTGVIKTVRKWRHWILSIPNTQKCTKLMNNIVRSQSHKARTASPCQKCICINFNKAFYFKNLIHNYIDTNFKKKKCKMQLTFSHCKCIWAFNWE